MKNLVLHEISMVRKPAFRLSRIREKKYTKAQMVKNVGEINEDIGMVYKCDACGGDCPGFTEFEMPDS
jgi:hypothetical protein